MKYRFAKYYGDEWLTVPAAALQKMQSAGETDLKVLLASAEYLSRGPVEEEELFSLLSDSFEKDEIEKALAFWRGAEIVVFDGKKSAARKPAKKAEEEAKEAEKKAPVRIHAEEPPFYSSRELSDAAEKDPRFKDLVSFTEHKLGKVLNTSETAKLYTFLDYLKLPPEVVMLSVEDCVSRGKGSLRYISAQLEGFANEGIDTYEKAEAHFARRRAFDQYAAGVRKLFGIGDRSLAAKEKEAIDAWQKWGYGEDVLNLAFEKTVSSAKKPTVVYMHKVLEGWHENGWLTADDVKNGKAQFSPDKTYDVDDFFQAAVNKTLQKG